MTLQTLKKTVDTPYFFSYQIARLFPGEDTAYQRQQLSRLVKNKTLMRLKRGIYMFTGQRIDPLVLAGVLYKPSYISLETALHIQGVIPEITSQITSVTPITTNLFHTAICDFSYSKLDKKLFFGFTRIMTDNKLSYALALPEKALLDWIYLRHINSLQEMRVDRANINGSKLNQFALVYPDWVRKVAINE